MPRPAHLPNLLLALGAALVLLLSTTIAALAQSYTVSDIQVNAAAGDAVQARAIAIDQGQREGLRRLLARLAEGGAVPSTGGVDIDSYVASFEVLSEQVSPTSYAATLAVNYRRGAVQALLDRQGVAYVARNAPPATLVPLWETGGDLLLWDAGNTWKAAWDGARAEGALQPFVVPLGDLQDLSLVDAEQAVRAETSSLQALAGRYGTEEVVVARLIGAGGEGTPLEVEAQRIGGAERDYYRATVQRPSGEPLEASLTRAVGEMQAAFDQRVRERVTVPAGRPETVLVAATVEGLDGWGRLLGLLGGLAEVETTMVREFSRDHALLALRVRGGATGLQVPLGRAGWRLTQREGNAWELVRGGIAPLDTSL